MDIEANNYVLSVGQKFLYMNSAADPVDGEAMIKLVQLDQINRPAVTKGKDLHEWDQSFREITAGHAAVQRNKAYEYFEALQEYYFNLHEEIVYEGRYLPVKIDERYNILEIDYLDYIDCDGYWSTYEP